MDYAALAKQLGGSVEGGDYASLATTFGGKAEAPKPIKLSAKERSDAALEGVGGVEKLLINLGAGLDEAWQGAKQFVGQGPDDAAVREKRALDDALADNTIGGSVAQFIGSMAPTLAIPGSGFVRGAQMLGRAAPTVARLGTKAAAADAAIGGALAGASQMTASDESKILNAAIGAVGGAAFTGLVASGKSVRDLLTRGGAESKAAERLIEAVGGEAAADAALMKAQQFMSGRAQRARSMNPSATKSLTDDIPMTVAEITQNPGLARAERTAQARYTEDWAPLRAEQAQERWNALKQATANDLDGARAARAGATDNMRERALASARPNDFVSPVQSEAMLITQGPGGANPATKRIAEYVMDVVGDADVPVTPERLYEVRKVLLNKLNGKAQLGDDLSAAVKGQRRETMRLVDSIDDALDGASRGQWKPYLKEYANKSGEVNSAEALTLIRKSFEKDNTAMLGGVPNVTGYKLGSAMEKHGKSGYGDKLTPQARSNLDELAGNVEMSEGLQKLMKLTGTSGGGSNTTMDLTGVAADVIEHKLGSVVPILGPLLKRADGLTQAAMSDALRNPEIFIAGVSKKLAQRKPLTRSEESVLALLRSAGAGGTLALTEPQ